MSNFTNDERGRSKAAEPNIHEGSVECVVEHESDFEVDFDGACTFILSKSHGYTPRPGQRVRLYEGGPYGQISGVELDGEEVFYRTPAEAEARFYEMARTEAAKVRRKNPEADEQFQHEGLPFADAFALGAAEEADRGQRQ